uniref:Phenylalanine--tRNA ligase alpha subunit n=1 Tax=Amphora coffeiformis TaxID=265554 RepID=A0A7S3LIF5_9STRA
MGYMRQLPNEDKPKLGAVVNQVLDEVESKVQEVLKDLKNQEILKAMENEKIDVTQPGLNRFADIGRRHPLSMTMEKAVDIFTQLGYDTITEAEFSPEVETDYYCFEALNCPKDHPARDMQDTFYLTEDREIMLRTHTSSVQIRALERLKPPLRIVAPGRVYRRDDIDATHSLMFHQVEILALEKRGELTLGHLKGTVEHFLKNMFGPDIKVRFRGSYFPFTEPSMEVDVFFRNKWLEVLGCGMVDPRVLEQAGIDPNEYSGFAAGFGVERFAMVIHGITDLREFYKNDKRFLEQFPHFYDDGVSSFLAGEPRQQPEPELRGETVPSKIVESVEELQEVMKAEGDKGKAQTKEKPKEEQAPAPESTEIDVSKLDIRVGVITKAWLHEEADKLFCEEIDIGEDSPRQIASGLRAHYNLEDLEGQRVLVLANLKARKLVGFPSHGMVMCASNSDGSVKFVEPPADAKIGERVMVEGYDGEPATENQVIKKKMLEQIFPDLKTNAAGIACYKGVPLTTTAGPCQPTLPNADVA